jgi:hypothetical protein
MNKEVSGLVFTSVEDMKSTLQCSEDNGNLDLKVLHDARIVCARMGSGYKTKLKILLGYISRLENKTPSGEPA